MQVDPSVGRDLAVELCEALHLNPHLISRIIIDIPCDGVTKVYTQGYAPKDSESHLADFCKGQTPLEISAAADVKVDEKGIQPRGGWF